MSHRSFVAATLMLFATGAGTPQAGAQGVAPAASDPFTQWTAAVSRRLIFAAKPPPNGPATSGRVVLRFTVDKVGKVVSRSVAESSGSDVYDKAALQALGKAQPFPPIPPSVHRDQVEMSQAIRFKYVPPRSPAGKNPS